MECVCVVCLCVYVCICVCVSLSSLRGRTSGAGNPIVIEKHFIRGPSRGTAYACIRGSQDMRAGNPIDFGRIFRARAQKGKGQRSLHWSLSLPDRARTLLFLLCFRGGSRKIFMGWWEGGRNFWGVATYGRCVCVCVCVYIYIYTLNSQFDEK